jgi:leucyl-tRNA synthetase
MCWRCGKPVQAEETVAVVFQNHRLSPKTCWSYCDDRLPGWPDKVTTMQKNWIGRSRGAEINGLTSVEGG